MPLALSNLSHALYSASQNRSTKPIQKCIAHARFLYVNTCIALATYTVKNCNYSCKFKKKKNRVNDIPSLIGIYHPFCLEI